MEQFAKMWFYDILSFTILAKHPILGFKIRLCPWIFIESEFEHIRTC